jgi:hypothetical protein
MGAACDMAAGKALPTNQAAASIPAGASVEAAPPADDGPAWPDESTEMAMRTELRIRGDRPAPQPPAEPPTEKDLPALATLVDRIPAATRAALEELFRAKFIRVKRIPERDLP